ncbi:MAG: hypothetical protein A2314_09485 [Elusimicrobia bacterium RIFOXYB2_FULL_50_12]|nr:MAG: hypothetical protein A2314_09485 [Elusimicrobia bacterium RIFOXYB2_FULL_50_12]
MALRLDLHVHSQSHGRTYITAENLRSALQRGKLHGVAITNFFDMSHALWLKKNITDFIILAGQEIWTKGGHIIGLGTRKVIEDFHDTEETIKEIHAQGGIAIAPHPYLFLGIGDKVYSAPVDAVESYNGIIGPYIIPNLRAKYAAKKRKLPQTASTDTMDSGYIGHSFTEVAADNEAQILPAICSGRMRLHKRSLPLPLSFIMKNLLYFKNIAPYSLHAMPCLICGSSMAVRPLKKKLACSACGMEQRSRILCSNGHYLCKPCIMEKTKKLLTPAPTERSKLHTPAPAESSKLHTLAPTGRGQGEGE